MTSGLPPSWGDRTEPLDAAKLDTWITGDWPEPERDPWPFLPLDDEGEGEA